MQGGGDGFGGLIRQLEAKDGGLGGADIELSIVGGGLQREVGKAAGKLHVQHVVLLIGVNLRDHHIAHLFAAGLLGNALLEGRQQVVIRHGGRSAQLAGHRILLVGAHIFYVDLGGRLALDISAIDLQGGRRGHIHLGNGALKQPYEQRAAAKADGGIFFDLDTLFLGSLVKLRGHLVTNEPAQTELGQEDEHE